MGKNIVKEKRNLLMKIFMKAITVRISLKEKASTHGTTEHAISEISSKESDKARVNGSLIPLILKSSNKSNQTDHH